jgi:hypothetical protein
MNPNITGFNCSKRKNIMDTYVHTLIIDFKLFKLFQLGKQ